MRVTEVEVTPVQDGKVVAYAKITLDDAIVIRGIRIIEGREKTFIAMPSKRLKNGNHVDLAFPVSQRAREIVESAVMQEYYAARESRHLGEPRPDIDTPRRHG